MTDQSEKDQAVNMVKAVHEEGSAEINGRSYKITKINHKKRLKVFSYFSHIQKDLERGDLLFLSTPEWESIELVIASIVTFDGMLLSKRPDHWEEYGQDYMMFVTTMLGAISYPFFQESGGS